MANQITYKTKCAYCGNEITFTGYDSVNATTDVELNNKLLNGTLFKVTCSSCQREVTCNYSIVYNNDDTKTLIHCAVGNDLYHAIITLSEFKQKYPQYKNYTIRAVASTTDLIEKVNIFNAGLDDRVIEIYKYLDVDGIKTMQPDANVSIARFYVEDGKNKLEFDTYFELSKEILPSNYQFIKTLYSKQIEDAEDLFVIDSIWAEELFK